MEYNVLVAIYTYNLYIDYKFNSTLNLNAFKIRLNWKIAYTIDVYLNNELE